MTDELEHNAQFYADLNNILAASTKDKNKGTTFLGDFTSYSGIELDFYGAELCILILVQIVIYNSLMSKMNGRFLRMVQWLHDMDFEILGNNIKSGAMMTYLSIVGYFYLISPFITLLLWAAYMFKDAAKNEQKLDHKNPVFLGAISILLLGLACFLSMTAVTKISWNNYRFKLSHSILFLIAYAAFTAWQFMIVFSSIYGEFNFQGISAVFLTQSGMIMTGMVYLNLYENKFNLIYFLTKFMKKDGEKPDPTRTNDFLEEIEQQKGDDDWMPSVHDIFDMISIGRVSEKKMMNAFGRGFQRIAMDNSAAVKMLINGSLFAVYAGVLFLYSWMVYKLDDGSKLGLVSSLAVVINDIYMYMMYNARIISRISLLGLIIFCSRLFIMLGGGDYWVYGYLVIFVWLECIIALGVVEKRLPYNSEMNVNQIDSGLLVKKTKFLDLARVPEFIFCIIVISLVISIVIATSFEPRGVYLKDLPIGDGIEYGAVTAVAVLIVVSFLFFFAWIRAFNRKLDNTVSPTYIYLCSKKVDSYYIFCIISYILCIFWTLGAYPFFDHKNVLVSGFCVPAILFCFFNVFIVYIKNNFYFIENVDAINRSVVAHNKRVDALKTKARKLRKIILGEGPDAVFGEENGRLVKKVMDMEVTRRQALKLAQELDEQHGGGEDNEADKKAMNASSFGRQFTIGSPRKSPTKTDANKVQPGDGLGDDQLVDIDGNDNGQETANPNNQLIKNNDSEQPKSPSKMEGMGATMQGFKLDDDSSEEDMDAVPSEMRAYRPTRIDKKRKRVHTWKDENINSCAAFFQGKMRSNDYVLVWSVILMSGLIIIYGSAASAVTENSLGIMFAFSLLHVIMLAISMMGNIIANRQQAMWERILQVLSFVMIYVAGIVYLFLAYEFSLLSKDDDELNEVELQEKLETRNFLSTQLILFPLVTNFLALGMKAYRDNTNGRAMTTGFWILLIIAFIQSIALTVVIFAFMDSGAAWGLVFLLIFALYSFAQYVMRVRYSNRPIKISDSIKVTPYRQNQIWNTMNVILGVGVFVGSAIYARSDDTTSDFASASIVIAILFFMLGFLILARWISDRTRMNDMPIYHSPWIFPIYKYYPKDNDVEPYSSAVVSFYFLTMLMLFWCIAATVEISPSWLGVALTCMIEGVMVIVSLYFMNTNNVQYRKIASHVDDLVIKQAWLNAKENLVRMTQIDDRSQYVSYETWWRRRHDLRNYMLVWQNKSVLRWPEMSEFNIVRQEFENSNEKGVFLRNRIEQWADSDEVDLDSWQDCQKFMYETDKDLRKAYMAELETIVQFQLIILQNAQGLKEEERKYLFKFIREKRAHLYLVGINFELSTAQSSAVRYAAALSEIQKMTPDKQTLFNALKVKFIDEERQKQIDEDLVEAKEAAANEARMEALAKMGDARKEMMQKLMANPDMPIDEMPDCHIKLKAIREFCKTNACKFTDKQFDHDNPSSVFGATMGTKGDPTIEQRAPRGWKRASEIAGSCLFKDGASHEDISQGTLGDCYLLSALSVLGNDRTVNLFECQKDSNHEDPNDPNHWKKTGCFMLTFHKNGEFQYIIVDDWLPMGADDYGGDVPAFTRGGPDCLEMWPAILEKAYAKLYGSYEAIEAGKVHMALSDLVENGFPEQLALKTYKNNLKLLASQLRNLDKNQALMGAGSPEHDQGDRAINEEGIVQGHAYAILDVADYQGEQLLKLRNPHGKASHTREWTGEWADDSDKWTVKSKAQLDYTPNLDEADGVFWMNNSDFLQNYKYIYLCRELTEKAGWTPKAIESSWSGQSSAGFPGKLRFVPQFKLTLTQPCSAFISLTQKGASTGSSFKGKNFIGWMVAKLQGKIMTKLDKRTLMTKAGISDLKMLSQEIDFDDKVSYPYSFTIVCGSRFPGAKGEGDFELKVYTRDSRMKLEKLN